MVPHTASKQLSDTDWESYKSNQSKLSAPGGSDGKESAHKARYPAWSLLRSSGEGYGG